MIRKTKIALTDDERDYLADKTFWDWKRAEVDVMYTKAPSILNEEAKKYFAEQEKFYKDLYNKLKLEEEKSNNGKNR